MSPLALRRCFLSSAALVAQLLLNSAQPLAQDGRPTQPATAAVHAAPAAAWTEAKWTVAARFLQDAGAEGLDPLDYRPAAATDMARTAAVLAYARDMALGRNSLRALDRDILLPEQSFDAAGKLAASLGDNRLEGFFAGLAPDAADYARLRTALARYRAMTATGGWPVLGAEASESEIHQRLQAEYPSLAALDDQAALKRFQEWHGLQADGVLSRPTLAALNVPAAERARQLEANMERWRWLPRPLETSRITVNVPAATLVLTVTGKTALESRVIVGKPATPTPIVRADAVGVTVNPPWTVPRSIAVKEMLPKLKRNHAWLQSQHIVLLNGPEGDPYGLTVNWRALSAGNFPYRLQQLPGPDNALGLIKLELPNRFDVYLHDTPARAAFAAPRRALSHGCVRVEQILPLASRALADDASEAAARIRDAIAEGKTRTLPLARTLPVYFLYWTAEADAAGEARFWPDLYGRDKRLLQRLQRPEPELRLAAQNVKCPTG